MATSKSSINRIKNWQLYLAGFMACFLLVIANSALWVSNSFFDSDNFVSIAEPALTSESSRNATASAIVEKSLQDRPVLQSILDGPLVSLVSGLLGSDQAQVLYQESLTRLHIAVTSKDPQNVEINLDPVKGIISRISTVAQESGREVQLNPENIPSKLVILDVSKLPNLYNYSVAMLWLGPIAAVLSIILLAGPYVIDKSRRNYKTLLFHSGVLFITFLVALSIGPLFKPLLLGPVNDPNVRVIVENVYDAFVMNFNTQSYWLLYLTIIGIASSFIWFMLSRGYFDALIKRLKKS